MLIHQDHYLGFLKDLFAALCRLFSEGKGFYGVCPFRRIDNWHEAGIKLVQCNVLMYGPLLFLTKYSYTGYAFIQFPLCFLFSMKTHNALGWVNDQKWKINRFEDSKITEPRISWTWSSSSLSRHLTQQPYCKNFILFASLFQIFLWNAENVIFNRFMVLKPSNMRSHIFL